MRSTRSRPRKPPFWAPPFGDPPRIVAEYAEMIAALPGVLGIWAPWERDALSVYTLIEPGDEKAENAVYRAEMAIRDQWPEAKVNFYISMDVDGFSEDMKETFEPSLVRLE